MENTSVPAKVMYSVSEICAALRVTHDTGTFFQGKAEKGYSAFYWTNEVTIRVWLDENWSGIDISKSKKCQRLCAAMARAGIAVNTEECLDD